jgi:tetratricopeptide (TPR) repeat protein
MERRRFLLGLGSFLIAGVMTALGAGTVGNVAAEEQRRQPILIPGIQEPEEMRVEPFPTTKLDLTAPERMLGEALEKSEKSKTATLLPALNRILAQYPDFSDGYIMRALALCEPGNDRAAITADLDRALNSIGSARMGKTSTVSLLSTRAKMEYLSGNYLAAMNNLEKAIHSDLGKATEFTNSGAAEPEKTASVCVWTEPDMNVLVQRFPTDYRSHMFRGLYFSFFVNFKPEDWIITRAMENFSKAAQLNPKSALPQLFKARLLGHFFVFNTRLNQLGWGDAERDKLNAELVGEYAKALALDPNLLLALEGRANALFNLKQFQKAIADYDRILSLDPQDGSTYHDRGLAKMQLGRDYDAISDLNSAIKMQPRELMKYHRYESRADAYMKTRQWNLAIRDLTTAISLQVGGSVLLMNIEQFRAIYPEYKSASNEAIARKLQQTFYSNLKYENFAKDFFSRRPLPSTVIPDLYLKRSDVYLKKGDWHSAAIEFRRAINGFPDYADVVDRWREIGQTADGRSYIDIKTFDDTRNDLIKVWIKQTRGLSEDMGPYEVRRFELNCGARQIRAVSLANYDASGNLIGSREGGRWGSVIPDTVGETLYSGACRAN